MFDKFVTKKNAFLISITLVLVALVIDPYLIGFCTYDKSYCFFDAVAGSIGKPLFLLSGALFASTSLILFARKEVFETWIRFAAFLIPLFMLVTMITPEYGGNGIVSVDRDDVALSFAVFFIAISAFIFIARWRSLPPLKK